MQFQQGLADPIKPQRVEGHGQLKGIKEQLYEILPSDFVDLLHLSYEVLCIDFLACFEKHLLSYMYLSG